MSDDDLHHDAGDLLYATFFAITGWAMSLTLIVLSRALYLWAHR